MLAGTKERMEWLRNAHARGRYLGMETELVSAREAKTLMPLLDERHFVGALYDPIEGHVDPYGVTQAYAKAARLQGAEIYLRTRVTDLAQRSDGGWDVAPDHGTNNARHVVNAAGLWAREVGRMVGMELPGLQMAHMSLLTEDMPEVSEANGAHGREVVQRLAGEGQEAGKRRRRGRVCQS